MKARILAPENRKWWTLAAVAFGLFMIMLDNTVVNVALPSIERDLHVSISELEWIVTAYALTFAALLITGGKLGDLYGRKLIFIVGIGIFTVSSLACGLAPNAGFLIGARMVQGVGAALMNPASLSIITATFPPRERGQAIGIWAGVSAMALAIGPLVGGVIVETINWNWIFYINVPVGILGIVVSWLVINESRDMSHEQSIDLPGLVTSGLGLFALTYALIEGNSHGWSSPEILVALRRGGRPARRVRRARAPPAAADARPVALQDRLVHRREHRRDARLARDVRRLLLRLPLCPEHPRLLGDPGRRHVPADDDPDHHRGAAGRASVRPDRVTVADGRRG